jgi:hypothetical protein
LSAHVAWLEKRGQLLWIENLRRESGEVRELLASFPALGRLLRRDGQVAIRFLPLPRAPYLVWYLHDESSGDVWMLRLFHARQKRPLIGVRRIKRIRRGLGRSR